MYIIALAARWFESAEFRNDLFMGVSSAAVCTALFFHTVASPFHAFVITSQLHICMHALALFRGRRVDVTARPSRHR